MPYVAAMHGDIFYPTFLLRMFLPTDVAMTWGFVLHLMLAGFFTFGFLRASGVRFQSAAIGGVAYLLSGAVASYASPGHDGKLFVSALLPAALWAIVRGVRDGRRAAWGALALIVGLAALSPHPQLLQYMLLMAGGFALFAALVPAAIPGESATASTASTATAAPQAATGATLRRLASPWWPSCSAPPSARSSTCPCASTRPGRHAPAARATSYAISFSFPLEETINMYLPQFSGILDNYWGRNGIHFHSEYLGASVLVLACFAFGGGLLNRHRKHAWFWLGALVGVAVLGLGRQHAVLPVGLCHRPRYEVLPRAEHDPVRRRLLDGGPRGVRRRARAGREVRRCATPPFGVGFALLVGVLATAGGFTNLAMGILGERADAIEANCRERRPGCVALRARSCCSPSP